MVAPELNLQPLDWEPSPLHWLLRRNHGCCGGSFLLHIFSKSPFRVEPNAQTQADDPLQLNLIHAAQAIKFLGHIQLGAASMDSASPQGQAALIFSLPSHQVAELRQQCESLGATTIKC